MEEDEVDTVEVYLDAGDEWRWRRKASGNNKILATSGEGYKNKQDLLDTMTRVNGGDYEVEEKSLYCDAETMLDGDMFKCGRRVDDPRCGRLGIGLGHQWMEVK